VDVLFVIPTKAHNAPFSTVSAIVALVSLAGLISILRKKR